MKAIRKAFFFFLVFFWALSSAADLPLSPPAPENACGGKIEGARCHAHLDNALLKHEGCQNLKPGRACSLPKAPGSLGHEENALTQNQTMPQAPGDNEQRQGYGNIALMPSAFFSLFGAMAGLFLVIKSRRPPKA